LDSKQIQAAIGTDNLKYLAISGIAIDETGVQAISKNETLDHLLPAGLLPISCSEKTLQSKLPNTNQMIFGLTGSEAFSPLNSFLKNIR